MATIITGGCAGLGDGSLQVGPYGEWVTDAGHTLTVNLDGTYRLCKAGSCSSGAAPNRAGTYYEVILQDFLAKPEAADLVPIITECLDRYDRLTGGLLRRGLSANDLPFDTANNLADGALKQEVSFECTEGGRGIEFVKVEAFHHEALAEQQAEAAKARETIPPAKVRPF